MSKFRNISPAEFSYIAHDTGLESPYVNQFFVEGKGEISKAEMEQAIQKAFAVNPGISLSLKGRWAFRYWSKGETPSTEDYTGNWSGESSENKAVIDQPFNTRTDVLASIHLFSQLDANHFKILFRIHHGICDGVGTLHWMKEVFRALRNESLLGSNSTLSELDIIEKETYKPAENLFTESRPVFPQSNNPEARGCHWVKCRWLGKDTKILAKLIYIIKTITEEEHGQCKTSFRIPADLRRYLNKEQKQSAQLSNISGLFDLKFDSEISVNDIQSKIVNAMRTKRDIAVYPKKLIKLTRYLPSSLFGSNPASLKQMHSDGLCNITAMISYVGKVELADYSCEGFSAEGVYAIPMPLEDKSIYIGLFTDENGILAVLSAPDALSNPEQTRLLSRKIEEKLAELE